MRSYVSLMFIIVIPPATMSSFIQNFSLQHFNSVYHFSNCDSFGTSMYKLSVTSLELIQNRRN